MPPTPVLKRPAFHAWLAPEGTDPATDVPDDQLAYHHVVIHHADQLRAELEMSKAGFSNPTKAPMHMSAMWLWAALTRTGRYPGTWQSFKAELVAYEPDKDRPAPHTDPEAEPDELDAVPTAASTS